MKSQAAEDYDRDNVAVVIPAYNEARTIRKVVTACLEQLSHVIVVDDGSQDGTREALEGLDITLLCNELNAGKAASLWRGLHKARELGMRAAITLDGDDQHDPAQIPRLVDKANTSAPAIIIAARLQNRAKAPKARLFANNFADFWISWAAGQPVTDSQSGYRFYPLELLDKVRPKISKKRGFVFESEFIIDAVRRGYGCQAIAIESIYRSGARPSHFRPVADITRIVVMVAGKLLRWGFYPVGLYRALRPYLSGRQ